MAAKKPVSKAKGTAVANWDEELAKLAEESAEMEANGGGGQFFSLKSGILSWQDNPMKNNEMAVIIVDSVLENTFYEGPYDPDNPQGPVCFAFGRDEKAMEPHKLVVEAGNAQNDMCAGCEKNEFGSADKGRGKACKNTRRLALIPAGTFAKDGSLDFIEDEDHFKNTEAGFMKLPVTSVKGYSTFVKQVSENLKRPPFGIVTKIKVIPDANSQFRVLFEPLMNVPDEFMGIVLQRHKDMRTAIDFPYVPFEEDEAPKKTAKKTPAKKRKY